MMVYGYKADGTFERDKDLMLAELGRPKMLDQVHLVVMQNIIDENNTSQQNDVLEIFYFENTTNENIVRIPWQTVSTQNLATKRGIIRDTLQQVYQCFPATHTGFITWDHGNVFGIQHARPVSHLNTGGLANFMAKSNLTGSAQPFTTTLEVKQNSPTYRWWELGTEKKDGGAHFRWNNLLQRDELDPASKPDLLTNEALAEMLLYATHNAGIQVLMMMNCWMHNLHSLYALNNACQYLVAPETIIDAPGYHFHEILRSANGGALPEQLCVKAVATIQTLSPAQLAIADLGPSYWAVFATPMVKATAHICSLQALLTLFIEVLQQNSQAKSLAWDTRKNAFEFDGMYAYDLIDLGNYFKRFIAYSSPGNRTGQLLQKMEQWQQDAKGLHCAAHLGRTIYDAGVRTASSGMQLYEPTGTGVSFPYLQNHWAGTRAILQYYFTPGSPLQSRFVSHTLWRDFLQLLDCLP